MRKLRSVKPREVIRALGKAGFVLKRIKGSHHIMMNNKTGRTVSVPYSNKDMKPGTLRNLLRHSGLSREEFNAFLSD